MKPSEILTKFRSDIAEAMTDAYRTVISHAGRFQYKVYIWSDGEIELLEGCQGDCSYLVPKSSEPRSLIYVCTVSEPYIDIWNLADESVPDDEAEKKAKEKEIIDCLVSDYRNNAVDYIIDDVIEKAKEYEEYEE